MIAWYCATCSCTVPAFWRTWVLISLALSAYFRVFTVWWYWMLEEATVAIMAVRELQNRTRFETRKQRRKDGRMERKKARKKESKKENKKEERRQERRKERLQRLCTAVYAGRGLAAAVMMTQQLQHRAEALQSASVALRLNCVYLHREDRKLH